MSITIENAEVEALLVDLTQATRRTAPDLLLEPLRRERARMSDEAEHRIAEGLAADGTIRRRWNGSPVADPRPIEEILAHDENGFPV